MRRIRIEFITSASTAERRVQLVNTPTGTMSVSTVETTVLDLVSHPNLSGAMWNVATIIGDMLQDGVIDSGRLADAAVGYPASTAQRIGWLLDYMAKVTKSTIDTEPLVPLAAARATPVLLDRAAGGSGERDRRWNVVVNELPDEESS